MSNIAPTPMTGPDAERSTPLTSGAVVLAQLRLHATVRFAVALVVAIGALLGGKLPGTGSQAAMGLAVTALILVASNVLLLAFLRRERSRPLTDRTLPRLRAALLWSILADNLALTLVIWCLGGARSPFLAFYLLNIIIAALLLPGRSVVLTAGLGCVLMASLVLAELTNSVPPSSAAPITRLTEGLAMAIIGAHGALFVLTAALLTALARALRSREADVLRLSEEREQAGTLTRQFLLITLHNLNSPIAAATTLLRNLREGFVGPLNEPQQEQVARSLKHMDVLRDFLHDLRTVCGLETGGFDVHPELVDISAVLAGLVEDHLDIARGREHRLELVVPEIAPAPVRGVKRLIQEAVANYITNAIKYTPPGGTITVRTQQKDGWVRVEVEDTGVGIAVDDQARLFDELVRIKQSDPRLGRVRGTGLGLSIVRRVIGREGGRVGVESAPGHGSTFWLELPVASDGPPDKT